MIAYLNKKFIPLEKAKISILDRGFLYADGVFETMRSYNGCIFLLEKHIERLENSLKRFNIRPQITGTTINKILYKLLRKNKLKNAYIKIVITRGAGSIIGGLAVPSKAPRKPTLAVYALPYKPPTVNFCKKGIKISIAKTRYNEKSAIAGNKTLNYLHNIVCRHEAEKKGFDEAVFLNTEGFITEATSSNIFLIKRKKIYTPSLKSGILPGITRQEVIRLAKKILNQKVNEVLIERSALHNADEIFLTNSLKEIIPVVKVGKNNLANGKPGTITQELAHSYKNAVTEYRARHTQLTK